VQLFKKGTPIVDAHMELYKQFHPTIASLPKYTICRNCFDTKVPIPCKKGFRYFNGIGLNPVYCNCPVLFDIDLYRAYVTPVHVAHMLVNSPDRSPELISKPFGVVDITQIHEVYNSLINSKETQVDRTLFGRFSSYYGNLKPLFNSLVLPKEITYITWLSAAIKEDIIVVLFNTFTCLSVFALPGFATAILFFVSCSICFGRIYNRAIPPASKTLARYFLIAFLIIGVLQVLFVIFGLLFRKSRKQKEKIEVENQGNKLQVLLGITRILKGVFSFIVLFFTKTGKLTLSKEDIHELKGCFDSSSDVLGGLSLVMTDK
jgi:hypothetical protein